MGSLILRTRLELLSSNLRDVERVVDLAKDRAKEIDALKTLLSGVRNLASQLTTRVERSLSDFRNDDQRSLLQNLTDAGELMKDLVSMLEESQRKIDSLLVPPVKLSDEIKARLSTKKPKESIDEVREALESSGSLTTAWEMEKRLATESEPLFAEYVDLLRGLALREAGVERGICELADRLLEGCDRSYGVWKSLAIPSYRGPVDATPANIVHLRFPEWTIWALPLAAHEFGKMMVRENQALARRVSQVPGAQALTPATLVDVLGDAFAMFTVGPAYACAAVLMRLDPRSIAPGQPSLDDPRARMILAMLQEADRRAGDAISFEPVLKPIERAWLEAGQEAGATPSAEPGPADFARLFWDWADAKYRTSLYRPESWLKAQELQKALVRRVNRPLPDRNDETPDPTLDVRDMLNAAWLFRLNAPDRADAIAREALAVWQEAIAASQEAASKQHKSTHFAPSGVIEKKTIVRDDDNVQPKGRTS